MEFSLEKSHVSASGRLWASNVIGGPSQVSEGTAQQNVLRSVDVWTSHKSWTHRQTKFYDPFGGFGLGACSGLVAEGLLGIATHLLDK